MKNRRKLILWIAIPIFLGMAAVYLRDDFSEWQLEHNAPLSDTAMDDEELARLSMKMCRHLTNDRIDEEWLDARIRDALASPATARIFAEEMGEMRLRRGWRDRYKNLSRELVTRWMLRAAKGGDPAAHLMVSMEYWWLLPVPGFSTQSGDKDAFARLMAKKEFTEEELMVIGACYSTGFAVPADSNRAQDYMYKSDEALKKYHGEDCRKVGELAETQYWLKKD